MIKKVLFVCLGNICRSPAAEGIFLNLIKKHRLREYFYVDSAGTGAWHVGESPDLRMCNAAEKRGVTLSSFARKISTDDFRNFDLILTNDENFFDYSTCKDNYLT